MPRQQMNQIRYEKGFFVNSESFSGSLFTVTGNFTYDGKIVKYAVVQRINGKFLRSESL